MQGVTSVSLFHEEAELPWSFPYSESHLSWLSGRFLSIKLSPSNMCNNSSKKQTLPTGTQLVGSKSTNNLKEKQPRSTLAKVVGDELLGRQTKTGYKRRFSPLCVTSGGGGGDRAPLPSTSLDQFSRGLCLAAGDRPT